MSNEHTDIKAKVASIFDEASRSMLEDGAVAQLVALYKEAALSMPGVGRAVQGAGEWAGRQLAHAGGALQRAAAPSLGNAPSILQGAARSVGGGMKTVGRGIQNNPGTALGTAGVVGGAGLLAGRATARQRQ